MKRLFLVAAATLMTLSLWADGINLYIVKTSSATDTYALTDLQKITFSGGNVVVTPKSGTASSVAIADIGRMYFDTEEGNCIGQLPAGSCVDWDGSVLRIDGMDGGDVKVFQTSGTLVASQPMGGQCRIDLSHLPKGIYVVSANGCNFKISKK